MTTHRFGRRRRTSGFQSERSRADRSAVLDPAFGDILAALRRRALPGHVLPPSLASRSPIGTPSSGPPSLSCSRQLRWERHTPRPQRWTLPSLTDMSLSVDWTAAVDTL